MTSVLVIAGVDSSGGAGLLRDTRTLTELGVNALCAVTAVTAQTDSAVLALHHIPAAVIAAQMRSALMAGARASVVKIGMLGTAPTVEAVAQCLHEHATGVPVILDPVLLSTSGGALLDPAGQDALCCLLLPLATLVTPNLPELASLLGRQPARNETEAVDQGRRLLERGPAAVLVKGGHGTGDESVDYLIQRSDNVVHRFALPRLSGTRRGTGCALASVIAGHIALGRSLAIACAEAKKYVYRLFS